MTDHPGRPVTYATPEAARACVSAVRGSASVSAALGPVYVAVPPAVRASGRWPALRAVLASLLPGVPLAEWSDLDHGTRDRLDTRDKRTVYLAATHRALIVVALREVSQRHLTPGVVAEARAFVGQHRPVMVFTGRRLAALADCRARPVDMPADRLRSMPRTRRPAALLDVPAAPPAPLPTLAACLEVAGVTDPAAVSRASAGGSGGRADGPDPDVPPRARGAASGRPGAPRALFRPAVQGGARHG